MRWINKKVCFTVALLLSIVPSFYILLIFANKSTKTNICKCARSLTTTTDTPTSETVLNNDNEQHNENNPVEKLIPKLIELAKLIKVAKQHVRGVKTNEALISARDIMNETLQMVKLDWNNVTKRRITSSRNICPEVYKQSSQGSPYCNTAHDRKHCKGKLPLSRLISIVMVFEGDDMDALLTLISAVRSYDMKVPILISAQKINSNKIDKIQSTNTKLFNNEKRFNVGKQLNTLLENVNTTYAFIARDITWFNSDARLERLISQIERLNVSTAGGAVRDKEGHWSKACQQRALRNYTLVYEAGYDVSLEECLFCDHLDGPFVIETKLATNISFDAVIEGEGIFEDFFLRLDKKEHIVCPDSMFFVSKTDKSSNPKDWKDFLNTQKIQRIKISGQEINIQCPKFYACKFTGGALSPCCHKENVDLVNAAMNMCEKLRIVCELDSGTLLGAVKLSTIVPWEVDADTFFVSSNYSVLNQSKQIFTDVGYDLSADDPSRDLKCCYEGTNLTYSGYFALRSKNWRLEYNGMPYLTSDYKFMQNRKHTKILLNGNWVRVPRNPGLVSRNCYGKEIYQHSLHGSESKTPGYPKFFIPCMKPGHHSCLDQYNIDGNLQFRDPIP